MQPAAVPQFPVAPAGPAWLPLAARVDPQLVFDRPIGVDPARHRVPSEKCRPDCRKQCVHGRLRRRANGPRPRRLPQVHISQRLVAAADSRLLSCPALNTALPLRLFTPATPPELDSLARRETAIRRRSSRCRIARVWLLAGQVGRRDRCRRLGGRRASVSGRQCAAGADAPIAAQHVSEPDGAEESTVEAAGERRAASSSSAARTRSTCHCGNGRPAESMAGMGPVSTPSTDSRPPVVLTRLPPTPSTRLSNTMSVGSPRTRA